jgi:hypothetical protein
VLTIRKSVSIVSIIQETNCQILPRYLHMDYDWWWVAQCTLSKAYLVKKNYETRVLSHRCPEFVCNIVPIRNYSPDNDDVWWEWRCVYKCISYRLANKFPDLFSGDARI